MRALDTLEHWAKDGFNHHDQSDWVRRGAASLGASILLAQLRQPYKIRPSKLVAGAGLLAVAYVDWRKLLRRKSCPEGTPSYRDDGCRCSQTPQDRIDEEAMESFPASDPPGHGGGHA
jgi:hypothetical protein